MLDTNILISACLKPDGLEAQVVNLALAGTVAACVTQEVADEYRDVLSRPKFAAQRERCAELLSALGKRAVMVIASGRVEAARDEDDNRFLECASAAGAAYLITGNLKDYPPNWEAARVVNAREFLGLFRC